MRQAQHALARLGGWLGRRGDDEPGAEVLAAGVRHLALLVAYERQRRARQDRKPTRRCV